MFCYLEMDADMDEFNNYSSSESLPSVSALFSDPQDPAHFKCDMSPATAESLPSISVLFDHLRDSAHLECDISSATSVNCEATTSLDSCPKCATGPGICDQCESISFEISLRRMLNSGRKAVNSELNGAQMSSHMALEITR